MAILTPDLMGGLGNQLFQICSAYGIAKELGFELKIPNQTLDPGKWKYYGYLFDLPKVDIGSIEYNHYLHEKNLQDIRPELSHLTGNVRIHAYLQKHIYFKKCLNELKTKLSSIINIEPFSLHIHIRRGDYVNLQDYHTNLVPEYFQDACKQIYHNYKPHKLQIFSDDLSYAQYFATTYLMEDYIRAIPFVDNSRSELHDFLRLRNSDYLITSNSTFSLMAAILGNHFEVYVPDESIWFGPKNKHLDTTGMIPDHFIRIKTN